MLGIWWDWKGIIHYELLPPSKAINSDLFYQQLMRLKLQEEKAARKSEVESARSLGQKTAAAETRAVAAEGDLRIEREWRISLQESMVKDRDKISTLIQEVESLKSIGQKYLALQEEQHSLRNQYVEAQKTLEEVGATLSENKLQLAELLERGAKPEEPTWAADGDATACTACAKEFTIARRKNVPGSILPTSELSNEFLTEVISNHSLRASEYVKLSISDAVIACGHIFCSSCSDKSITFASNTRPVRVCDACYAENVTCKLNDGDTALLDPIGPGAQVCAPHALMENMELATDSDKGIHSLISQRRARGRRRSPTSPTPSAATDYPLTPNPYSYRFLKKHTSVR
ncbi:RUN and FYVE domain-containing protein 2 [Eumeta japonica]|uniref:RUN and FYVE domain-containing protein 2 n=1 Tax=Eumeta variegata TaxID=151549 RepID=A0A4C1SWA0_EUMVA|nr:RUN and FYVE domain-containing protein 2 [Eumeta japonica]